MKNAGHVFPIKGHEREEVKNEEGRSEECRSRFPIKGHEREEVSSEDGRMPFGARPAPKGLTQILNS